MRDMDQINALFDEKVKFVEQNSSIKDMEMYFTLQVGPKDAKTIMSQMRGFFVSGYIEGRKDVY